MHRSLGCRRPYSDAVSFRLGCSPQHFPVRPNPDNCISEHNGPYHLRSVAPPSIALAIPRTVARQNGISLLGGISNFKSVRGRRPTVVMFLSASTDIFRMTSLIMPRLAKIGSEIVSSVNIPDCKSAQSFKRIPHQGGRSSR